MYPLTSREQFCELHSVNCIIDSHVTMYIVRKVVSPFLMLLYLK